MNSGERMCVRGNNLGYVCECIIVTEISIRDYFVRLQNSKYTVLCIFVEESE